VLEHLRNVLCDIEELDSNSEWERIEKELRRMFDELEKDQQKYGDSNTAQMVNQLRSSVDQAIRVKDVKLAKDVLQQVRDLDYKLALIEYLAVWIINWNRDFDSQNWKDRNRARQLVNQGMSIINNSPTAEKLLPIVQQIINLLPAAQLPQGADGLLQG
jgi:molecular chaperone DnaK